MSHYSVPKSVKNAVISILIPVMVFVMSGISVPYAQADISNGLVGYWNFNVDGDVASGKIGKAQSFPIVGTGFNTTQVTSVTNFTLSAWMKTTSTSRGDIIMAFDAADNNYHGFGLVMNPNFAGCTGLGLWVGESAYICTPDLTGINDDAWHLVTATWDNTTHTGKVFVDKVEKVSSDAQTGNLVHTAVTTLGHNLYDNSDYIGLLDDVRIFDRVLSASEIAELYDYTGSNPQPNNTPPTIALIGAPYMTYNVGETYVEEYVTISDAQDSEAQLSVNVSPSSVNTNAPGITVITYTVTDTGGLSASVTRTIEVIGLPDTTAPVITPQSDISAPATSASGAIITFILNAIDDVDGPVNVICSPASGTLFPVTTTQVACTAKDAAQNQSSTNFNVTVSKTVPTYTVAADSKVYDGTTDAQAIFTITNKVVESDDVSITGTASFANKNTGIGKVVTISNLALTGADAGKYDFAETSTTTTADIYGITLIPVIEIAEKTYDGTTDASIVSCNLIGVIGSEDVSCVPGTAVFDSSQAGNDKSVSVTGLSLAGADVSNYKIPANYDVTGTINKIELLVTLSDLAYAYDGDSHEATYSVDYGSNSSSGSTVSVTYNGSAALPVNAGSYAVVATLNHVNYSGQANGTLVISPKSVSATVSATSRAYDGTTDAAAEGEVVGAVDGDSVTATVGSASFDTEGVGAGKTVTVTGIALAGADAGNYTLTNNSAVTTASITPRTLVGSITADNKVYDGTDTADIASRNLTGVVGSDDVSYVGGTATFESANAGTGKIVTATGLSLTGADATNYEVNSTATASADITRAAATIGFSDLVHAYDGTPKSVTATTTPDGLTVSITYDGIATAPTAGGTYAVMATITDNNYAGSAMETLIIIGDNTPAPAPEVKKKGGGGGGSSRISPVERLFSLFDFNTLLVNWGKKGPANPGDFNNDGVVDLLDFNLLLIKWNN